MLQNYEITIEIESLDEGSKRQIDCVSTQTRGMVYAISKRIELDRHVTEL